MEAIIKVEEVSRQETRGGNTRYVIRDEAAHEYTTFRPQIGEEAWGFRGKTARIEFHEEQRGEYKNVYLDRIEPAPGDAVPELGPDEVAWQIAAQAAALLVGSKPGDRVPPDELFEKLKPFKDRVAADLKSSKLESKK